MISCSAEASCWCPFYESCYPFLRLGEALYTDVTGTSQEWSGVVDQGPYISDGRQLCC